MTALHHPEANHPDIGHLHVNSELHPDVGVVHEDEYDARMDQVPPYDHHSDQGNFSRYPRHWNPNDIEVCIIIRAHSRNP